MALVRPIVPLSSNQYSKPSVYDMLIGYALYIVRLSDITLSPPDTRCHQTVNFNLFLSIATWNIRIVKPQLIQSIKTYSNMLNPSNQFSTLRGLANAPESTQQSETEISSFDTLQG